MRNGEPIQDHHISNRVNANITYDQSFSEWEACIAAGLDIERWENNGYPGWLKARTVAWHWLHNLIKTNAEDAMNKAAKKKGRK